MTDTPASPDGTRPAKSGRWRRLRRNLLASILPACALLICLETGLRLTELAPTATLAFPDERTWDEIPGPFAPGQDFVDRMRPDLPHRIRVNALGFRGHPIAFEKPPGVRRILCLGGSYVFGAYVNEEETFPAALEKKLRQIGPETTTEVINAGVSGYTIADQAALAVEKGFSLEPDIVIVGCEPGDLPDLAGRISRRESQRLASAKSSRSPLTPIRSLLAHTATWNSLFALEASLLGRLHLDRGLQERQVRRLLHPPFDRATEALFDGYRAALLEINDAATRRGCRVVLVIFPLYEQVLSGAPSEVQARLVTLAEAAGIPAFDLLPAFRAGGARAAKLFLMPLDRHLSAAGQRLAAREVSRFIANGIPDAERAR